MTGVMSSPSSDISVPTFQRPRHIERSVHAGHEHDPRPVLLWNLQELQVVLPGPVAPHVFKHILRSFQKPLRERNVRVPKERIVTDVDEFIVAPRVRAYQRPTLRLGDTDHQRSRSE